MQLLIHICTCHAADAWLCIADLLRFRLLLCLVDFRFHFCIGRRRKLVAALQPHAGQLLVDFLLSRLPLFDLGQALAQLRKFLLHARLLAFSADALELPLVALLALTESERIRVVALERGAC